MEEEKIVVESSSTAKNTFNPIRSIVDRIKVHPNPEKPLISVSLGDPTVFGNLKSADSVKEALVKAVKLGKADGYAPSVGNKAAREAISNRYKTRFRVNFDPEDIFIASGCSGALDLAISVLCGPGDAILIPKPGFKLYETLAGSKGIKSLGYPLNENDNWQVKLDVVEKIFVENRVSIKAWLINNPSNPCGSVYSRDHLIDCLKLSAPLQWECIRKFNSFMVKRDGAYFSTERGNLMNKHSYKYSGLVHSRSVRVEADEKGVTVSCRRSKVAGNKVATAFSKPALFKASVGHKSLKAKIAADLEGAFYRRDLIPAAQTRAAKIVKAQRFSKN